MDMDSKLVRFRFSANIFYGVVFALTVSLLGGEAWATSASPLPGASTVPLPVVSPTTAAVLTVTPAEAKSLAREFQRSQKNALLAFDHRGKMEIKELKASHGARSRDFERRESEARHVFFSQNKEGPKRRDYVKAFQERRKLMLSMLKEEADKKKEEVKVKRESLKREQKEKMTQFLEVLGHGERPPEHLWQ